MIRSSALRLTLLSLALPAAGGEFSARLPELSLALTRSIAQTQVDPAAAAPIDPKFYVLLGRLGGVAPQTPQGSANPSAAPAAAPAQAVLAMANQVFAPYSISDLQRMPDSELHGLAARLWEMISPPRSFDDVPALDARYAEPDVRSRTVAVLGSSKDSPAIAAHVQLAREISGELIHRGYNIVTAAGSNGILGAASGAAHSARQAPGFAGGVPGESLAIVKVPAWGDEDLARSRAIGKAASEAERVEKFALVSDTFLIFPGGAATLQEAATLIANNKYRGDSPAKTVILIGRKFFSALKAQYGRLNRAGLLGAEPRTLFTIIDSAEEALRAFPPLPAPRAPAAAPAPSAAAESAFPVTRGADYDKLYTALKYELLGRRYYNSIRALDFARQYHNGTRKDGVTPEFQHQLSIALYILNLKGVKDMETVLTAALLHDVMEDYDVGYKEIKGRFGKKVARVVWLLTKQHRGRKKDVETYFAEIAEDPAASVIKGADRIHNVQSMVGVFSVEKQKAYIDEVKRYFLPMLKKASYNFPEQSAAYFTLEHMLKSQLELLAAVHAAVAR